MMRKLTTPLIAALDQVTDTVDLFRAKIVDVSPDSVTISTTRFCALNTVRPASSA